MCFYSHNSPPLPSVSVSSPMTINTVSYFPLTHIIVIISAVMGCRFSNMQPIFVSENTNKYIFFSAGELPGLGLIQIYDSTLFQPGLGRPSIVIKYNLTHQIQWERKVLRPVHKTWRRDIITDFIIIQLNKSQANLHPEVISNHREHYTSSGEYNHLITLIVGQCLYL